MELIMNNLDLLVAALITFILVATFVIKYLSTPTEKRKDMILTWLLHSVIEAERMLGSKTGQVKFAQVYDTYLKQFPVMSKFFPKEVFVELVNEALNQMKHLIETNIQVKQYIEGDGQ